MDKTKTYIQHKRIYITSDNVKKAVESAKNSKHIISRYAITKSTAKLSGNDSSSLYPKGGKTEVEIYDVENKDEPKLVAKGEAFCSLRDNFSKSLGKRIALGRALKILRGI